MRAAGTLQSCAYTTRTLSGERLEVSPHADAIHAIPERGRDNILGGSNFIHQVYGIAA